jgi:hypothetical protein
MHAMPMLRSLVLASFALAGCKTTEPSKTPPEPAQPVTTVTMAGPRPVGGFSASPTEEPGIYDVPFAVDQITKVKVVTLASEGKEGRELERSSWSFDPATGRLRVDQPIDDEHERVVVLGTRASPPRIRLPEGTKLDTVRVVVGDRLGIEGRDYAIDGGTRVLTMLGPDTTENPLRYYVQATLEPDPAHPGMSPGVSFGNHGDQATIRRVLGITPQ